MTLVPKVALATLLKKQYRVQVILPIKEPDGVEVMWTVRWQDLPGSIKHRRLPTEAEALRFRDHLAAELERTSEERRAAERSANHQPRKPSGSGGGGAPQLINRREQATPELAVSITTAWRDHRAVYTVAVITNDGAPTRLPKTYDSPTRARSAANRLYNQLTKEK